MDTLKKLDLTLLYLNSFEPSKHSKKSLVEVVIFLSKEFKETDSKEGQLILNKLYKDGYITIDNYIDTIGGNEWLTDRIYEISYEGRIFISNDTFDGQAERESAENSKQRDKLDIDLANAKRVYKTYFTTQTITWVSFIVMLILSALQLAEILHIWPYHK